MITFLERELITKPSPSGMLIGDKRPAPFNPQHWEGGKCVPLDSVKLEGPWALRRWWQCVGVEQVLDTAAVGAKLAFEFAGRVLTLAFDFDKTCADFRYRIDDQAWATYAFDRPALWCGPGWYRTVHLAEDLPPGRHKVELEVVHGDRPECMGTNFRLALIGVVP
jgi:hypothetical protein